MVSSRLAVSKTNNYFLPDALISGARTQTSNPTFVLVPHQSSTRQFPTLAFVSARRDQLQSLSYNVSGCTHHQRLYRRPAASWPAGSDAAAPELVLSEQEEGGVWGLRSAGLRTDWCEPWGAAWRGSLTREARRLTVVPEHSGLWVVYCDVRTAYGPDW